MNQDATSRDVMTMTPEEVAQRLGISAWWVREQIRRGRVPHLRFGRRRIALLPAHVDAIIELVTVEPVGWQGAARATNLRLARAETRQSSRRQCQELRQST
jgi:excisionase family DNA binding protein